MHREGEAFQHVMARSGTLPSTCIQVALHMPYAVQQIQSRCAVQNNIDTNITPPKRVVESPQAAGKQPISSIVNDPGEICPNIAPFLPRPVMPCFAIMRT